MGLGLLGGERERAGALVVAIGAEGLDRLTRGPVGGRTAEAALDEVGGSPQVVGGVVGAEVGAVAEDRAVLHEAVPEKDLLPALDVPGRVDQRPLRIDDTLGDRRLGLIGPVGEQAEDEEAEEDDEQDRLNPTL